MKRLQFMQRKRDLKKLYKPPSEQDYSENYKKLVIVILISFVFIAAQLIAAIISDAIHLISDTIGFFTSFLFLYLSKWRPTEKMSFGYHRMELLGAIANIFIIWILIFFVVYESTHRIIDKQFVEEPMAMLITAGGGLIVNIIMYKVLHNGQNHSHGLLSDGCGHDHSHQHGNEHNHNENGDNKENKNKKQSKSQTQGYNQNLSEVDCLQDICKDDDCNLSIQVIHCHKNSDIHKHKLGKVPRKLSSPEKQQEQKVEIISVKPREVQYKHPMQDVLVGKVCEQQHQHSNLCYLNQQKEKKEKHQHHHQHKQQHQQHKHKHQREALRLQDTFDQRDKKQHRHQHNGQCDHNHKQEQKEVQKHDHKHGNCGGHHDHEHSHAHHDHNHHDHDHNHDHGHKAQDDGRNASLGMQAAVLHALSDMIMSVGLIISALVIFFLGNPGKGYSEKVTQWNPWHLFDPLSTYIFSIIALASTIPVVKNSYLLLMESTPSYINLTELRRQCQEIEGVIDIHDIHVWDLKPGKTCLIAHVLAKKDTQRRVLVELSDIARKNKIYHSTFQVEEEEWKDEDNYILCDHDIH